MMTIRRGLGTKVMSDFPSEKNPQPCKNGCGTKIYLSDKKQKGRWLPYELDGTVHDCPKKSQNGSTSTTTTETETKKEEFTLEAVQKKLASIGITLDLDKLMNQK